MGTEKRERQKANRALKHQQEVRQQSRRKLTRWIVIGVGAVAGVFLLAWIAGNFVGEDDPVTPLDTVLEPVTPADTVAPESTSGPASTAPTTATTEG